MNISALQSIFGKDFQKEVQDTVNQVLGDSVQESAPLISELIPLLVNGLSDTVSHGTTPMDIVKKLENYSKHPGDERQLITQIFGEKTFNEALTVAKQYGISEEQVQELGAKLGSLLAQKIQQALDSGISPTEIADILEFALQNKDIIQKVTQPGGIKNLSFLQKAKLAAKFL